MLNFINGLVTMGYATSGLFFAKFWRGSRDPLFMIFAIAFWLLTANQLVVTLLNVPREEQSWAYLLRLAAFTLLALGIIYKNAARRSGRR